MSQIHVVTGIPVYDYAYNIHIQNLYFQVSPNFRPWYSKVCFDSLGFDLAGAVIRGDHYGNADFFCSGDLTIPGGADGPKVHIMFTTRGTVVSLKSS